MASYQTSVQCNHTGCKKRNSVYYNSRKDYREYGEAWRQRHSDWLCELHDGGHLDMNNLRKSGEIVFEVVPPKPKFLPSLEGRHFFDQSTLNRAVKWNADANDFPLGTKIIERMTVEVILPEAETP